MKSSLNGAAMTFGFELVVDGLTGRATLTFYGSVRHADAATAVRQCLALPRTIRSLRIDIQHVADVSGDAHEAIAALVYSWRRARGGRIAVERVPNATSGRSLAISLTAQRRRVASSEIAT
jgi:hypothetical protein